MLLLPTTDAGITATVPRQNSYSDRAVDLIAQDQIPWLELPLFCQLFRIALGDDENDEED